MPLAPSAQATFLFCLYELMLQLLEKQHSSHFFAGKTDFLQNFLLALENETAQEFQFSTKIFSFQKLFFFFFYLIAKVLWNMFLFQWKLEEKEIKQISAQIQIYTGILGKSSFFFGGENYFIWLHLDQKPTDFRREAPRLVLTCISSLDKHSLKLRKRNS